MSKKVGIIMGSDSDLPIIKKATDMLKSLQIPFEVHIYSAHRTPVEAAEFAKAAKKNGDYFITIDLAELSAVYIKKTKQAKRLADNK